MIDVEKRKAVYLLSEEGMSVRELARRLSLSRKAVRKIIWFVETNFFPGRTFSSIEDLNQQALQWATERIPLRAHAKSTLLALNIRPNIRHSPYISENGTIA